MEFLPDVVTSPGGHHRLRLMSHSRIISDDDTEYSVADDIMSFIPCQEGEGPQAFYDKFGWQKNENGDYCETVAFSDRRPLAAGLTSHCMLRLKDKYFSKGGKFLLDAGCGPIAHPELLSYGDAFETRVCLDVSSVALQHARAACGGRGVYLHASIADIPLASSSMDAVMCYHVIYQLPLQLQVKALCELWRVLKPGGVGVFVYMWPRPAIPGILGRMARVLGLRNEGRNGASVEVPSSDHDRLQPREWLEAQRLPFDFDYDVYRVVDNNFLRDYVSADRAGRSLVGFLRLMQDFAPRLCGRHGSMPAIVVRKS